MKKTLCDICLSKGGPITVDATVHHIFLKTGRESNGVEMADTGSSYDLCEKHLAELALTFIKKLNEKEALALHGRIERKLG